MALRLGFVGCGKWARKLAESFRACGAEVVHFDRKKPDFKRADPRGMQPGEVRLDTALPLDGFGEYQPWWEQIKNPRIDAIVAVAPPEITTEVAMACAAAGKPVMATKPLFDHPERITAPFYVDFWRLWSEAQRDRESDNFCLHGAGPIRSFPGSFDYGPHVMAAVLNIDPMATLVSCRRLPTDTGELFECDMQMHVGTAVAYFGNGSKEPVRNIWGAPETPTHIGSEPKEAIMQKFCRSFMSDVSEGFVSTDLLNYSREGMALLEKIRREAK